MCGVRLATAVAWAACADVRVVELRLSDPCPDATPLDGVRCVRVATIADPDTLQGDCRACFEPPNSLSEEWIDIVPELPFGATVDELAERLAGRAVVDVPAGEGPLGVVLFGYTASCAEAREGRGGLPFFSLAAELAREDGTIPAEPLEIARSCELLEVTSHCLPIAGAAAPPADELRCPSSLLQLDAPPPESLEPGGLPAGFDPSRPTYVVEQVWAGCPVSLGALAPVWRAMGDACADRSALTFCDGIAAGPLRIAAHLVAPSPSPSDGDDAYGDAIDCGFVACAPSVVSTIAATATEGVGFVLLNLVPGDALLGCLFAPAAFSPGGAELTGFFRLDPATDVRVRMQSASPVSFLLALGLFPTALCPGYEIGLCDLFDGLPFGSECDGTGEFPPESLDGEPVYSVAVELRATPAALVPGLAEEVCGSL